MNNISPVAVQQASLCYRAASLKNNCRGFAHTNLINMLTKASITIVEAEAQRGKKVEG